MVDKPDILGFHYDKDDELFHYGTPRHSGRFPWGSGKNPYQRSGDFLSAVDRMSKDGMSEKEIVDKLNEGVVDDAKWKRTMSIAEFRAAKAVAAHQRKEQLYCEAQKLMNSGMSRNAAAKQLGINESTLRSLENEQAIYNRNAARKTADILKSEIEKKGVIDVGDGVEIELGISKTKLNEALYILEAEEGYMEGGIGVKNTMDPTGRKQTTVKVLCRDQDAYKEAYADNSKIKPVVDYKSDDNGETFRKIQYPSSVDSKRVAVRYAEDGGKDYDGVIEIRPGVKDLDLGNSHYAQVRVMVDGTHYLKGMAVYSDDIPEGKDIIFNTNKHKGTPMMDPNVSSVLKPIKSDPNNPFGATIKADGQYEYKGADGKKHLSPLNKIKEEGEWDTASSKTLSSQFLSKQPIPLIKKQLDIAYDDKKSEFDNIMALENPTVRRKMLGEFAASCESAAVHMKAAALPGQRTHVILPVRSLKDNEVFAPNYPNGQEVILVRYPHGGTFEIPRLKVNNKNKEAISRITMNARDAIGINSHVSDKLSGADFDGDTVVLIPTSDKVKIKTQDSLKGLAGFDPKEQYPYRPGMSILTEDQKQKEMGKVSNLITDMTLQGAKPDELAAAVRHSMVVIDATKHKLDYKQSEIDNNIKQLKRIYQKKENGKYGGAATLISMRKQDLRVPERKGSPRINPNTGKLEYKETGRMYEERKEVKVKDPVTGKMVAAKDPITGKTLYKGTGKYVEATTKSKLITETDDLRTLSSGTKQENLYADYGNSLKALANTARKEQLATERLAYSPEAARDYAQEVTSLNAKLKTAIKNKPRERTAQAKANAELSAYIQANPDIEKKDKKKLRTQVTARARQSVGASGKKTRVDISDKEWEAIQAGAIHDTKLMNILQFSDPDRIHELAMPNEAKLITPSKQARMKSLLNNGYSNAEIAKALGVSVSTVSKYLN